MLRSGFAFVVVLSLLFGYEAYALFVHESGLTSNLPPADDLSLTREVAGTAQVAQTFKMHADGFYAIDVYPRHSQRPPKGPVIFTLLQGLPAGWTQMARVTVPSAQIDGTSPVRVVFPRIDQSARYRFLLRIAMPEATAGEGLLFETSGFRYPEGEVYWNDEPAWGDLKFRTKAQRTTVFRNILHERQSLPGPLRTDLFWVSALVVLNVTLAAMVYGLRQ